MGFQIAPKAGALLYPAEIQILVSAHWTEYKRVGNVYLFSEVNTEYVY